MKLPISFSNPTNENKKIILIMDIKITELYEFAGTRVRLDRTKIYEAKPADDLPDFIEMEWVRILGVNEPHGLCLKKGEYEIVGSRTAFDLRLALA